MKYLKFDDKLNQYISKHNNQDDELLKELRELTYQKTGRRMMISPDQAQFFRTLLALIKPKKYSKLVFLPVTVLQLWHVLFRMIREFLRVI